MLVPDSALRNKWQRNRQMVGCFDPSAITVDSQEHLLNSNNIWRSFVCHPKTEAIR